MSFEGILTVLSFRDIMNFKGLIVIFLILALIPVFLGKVQIGQFGDFFKSPSWDGFKSAFSNLLANDYNFYKSLVSSWIGNFLKEKIAEIFK